MRCPKCGNQAIQKRLVTMAEHEPTELKTCLECGMILQDQPISSYVAISEDQYKKKTKHVRGGFNRLKCSVVGCDRQAECKAVCNMHYQRFAKYRHQLARLQSNYSDVIHAVVL